MESTHSRERNTDCSLDFVTRIAERDSVWRGKIAVVPGLEIASLIDCRSLVTWSGACGRVPLLAGYCIILIFERGLSLCIAFNVF